VATGVDSFYCLLLGHLPPSHIIGLLVRLSPAGFGIKIYKSMSFEQRQIVLQLAEVPACELARRRSPDPLLHQ
jgi:hypothetical protein